MAQSVVTSVNRLLPVPSPADPVASLNRITKKPKSLKTVCVIAVTRYSINRFLQKKSILQVVNYLCGYILVAHHEHVG